MPDTISNEDLGEALLRYLISANLYDAECDEDHCGIGCTVSWTEDACEKIGQRVKELLAEGLVP